MQENDNFLGNGLLFPLQTSGGKVGMVEGDELIKQSIRIILGTPVGSRVMNYEFGCQIYELLFAPNNNSTAHLATYYVKEALTRWEPRIEVNEVTAAYAPDASNQLDINVNYTIRSRNTHANLVYPFYLQRG